MKAVEGTLDIKHSPFHEITEETLKRMPVVMRVVHTHGYTADRIVDNLLSDKTRVSLLNERISALRRTGEKICRNDVIVESEPKLTEQDRVVRRFLEAKGIHNADGFVTRFVPVQRYRNESSEAYALNKMAPELERVEEMHAGFKELCDALVHLLGASNRGQLRP
jgi:hypothetical protein